MMRGLLRVDPNSGTRFEGQGPRSIFDNNNEILPNEALTPARTVGDSGFV